MARVLLVNPPFYRLMGSHYNGISLGIAYLASTLNHHGHDAWTYNADHLDSDQYRKLYDCFHATEDYASILNRPDHDLWNEVIESIRRFSPDWVGFTGYTANIKAIGILSEKLRKALPEVRQVVGGVISTLDPGLIHQLPFVDFCVRREGEVALLALVEGKDPATLPGVVSRKQASAQTTIPIKEIDSLIFPERTKLWGSKGALSAEEKKKADVSYMITARGCPYRCSFCASPRIWGRGNTTFRSPENVIAEMRQLKQNFWQGEHPDFGMLSSNSAPKKELLQDSLVIKDNTIVYFVDDIFTLKKSRTREMLTQISDSGLNMPWKCESRADTIDEEVAELLAAAGCKRVKIGFESGSDRILQKIKKDETRADMEEAVRFLKKAGVPITAYFMAGFPGETDQDLKQTIEFARSLEANYYSLSILAPYHGTQIEIDLNAAGENSVEKQPWEYFFHQSRKLLVNSQLSDSILEEFWGLCNTQTYV